MVKTEGMLQTLVSYQECPALRDQKGKRGGYENVYFVDLDIVAHVNHWHISHYQNTNSWTREKKVYIFCLFQGGQFKNMLGDSHWS